jgi:TfoX N-terminal domain
MGYDQELADRIRRLIGSDPDLTAKKMFGGLAFPIAGNKAIAASSQGGAMARVDPEQSDALVATTKAQPGGDARPTDARMAAIRPMPGWLHVSSANLRTDDQLTPWVQKGAGYARSLPPAQGVSAGHADRSIWPLPRSPFGTHTADQNEPIRLAGGPGTPWPVSRLSRCRGCCWSGLTGMRPGCRRVSRVAHLALCRRARAWLCVGGPAHRSAVTAGPGRQG